MHMMLSFILLKVFKGLGDGEAVIGVAKGREIELDVKETEDDEGGQEGTELLFVVLPEEGGGKRGEARELIGEETR
jgi:hypothetical protein